MNKSPFPKPRFNRGVYIFSRLVALPYLHLALGIKKVHIQNESILNDALTESKKQGHTLLLAFRHTAKEDAPLLYSTVRKAHVRFLYGRDVLYWAGKITQFIFPRLGFIAVQNRGTNKEGMHFLRKEAQTARFPLALAPEGQVTYHSYHCFPLQVGVGTITTWALENQQKVTIIPIGIGYRYPKADDKWVDSLIDQWGQKVERQAKGTTLQEKLRSALEQTLEIIASIWNVTLVDTPYFPDKRDELCEKLLDIGEIEAGLDKGKGTILDRLYRLRFAGNDILYVLKKTDFSSEIQKNIYEYKREKAKNYLRISQVVDILQYLDPSYLQGRDVLGRSYETVLNLLDLMNRIEGGNIDSRHSPSHKHAYLQIGTALSYTESTFDGVGRKSKQHKIREDVQQALTQCGQDLEDYLVD